MAEYKLVNATQLDADLTNIANSIRNALGAPLVTIYYEATLSYAEDDTEYANPIFTKTDIVVELTEEQISDLPYYESGYHTTTGEPVYTLNMGELFVCPVTSVPAIDFQDFPKKINEVYEASRYYAAEQAQGFGTKTDYRYWRYGQDITNLLMPYRAVPINATQMLSNTTTTDGSLIDLRNYDIDFSKCTTLDYFINLSPISAIGTLDTTACSNIKNLLYNATELETIEHLILKEDGSQTNGNNFGLQCKKLKYINKITGQFGESFRIYHNSNVLMDHDTVINILNALKDYSGTSTSPVCMLYSNGWNAVSEEEKKIGTDKGWTLA